MEIIVRRAEKQDVDSIFALIQELALFEKAPHEVENSPEQILKDGFGESPLFGCLLAEADGNVVGMSLYYFRYSTWKGKRLYLEDIIVTESHRGHQIGQKLFDETIQESVKTNCNGMMWQVLDWNTPAIEFYKKFNANFDSEWTNCTISGKQAREYIQK